MKQDPLFEIDGLGRRFETQVLAQTAPKIPERLSLLARPVEGEHQELPQSLAIRERLDQAEELADDHVVFSRCQHGIHQPLDRRHPFLVELTGSLLGELELPEIGQHRASPLSESLAEPLAPLVGMPPMSRVVGHE